MWCECVFRNHESCERVRNYKIVKQAYTGSRRCISLDIVHFDTFKLIMHIYIYIYIYICIPLYIQ